jgi:hypothetical protein
MITAGNSFALNCINQLFVENRSLEDKFFVLKIYRLDQAHYEGFYNYQQDHYLKSNPSQEEAFFKRVALRENFNTFL